ncbi:hypothetical secretion protein [Vibrionales bacterium SWAT-3]|nr:hypothetical secretion protein [Vibrionales bacterium SWAT-3]
MLSPQFRYSPSTVLLLTGLASFGVEASNEAIQHRLEKIFAASIALTDSDAVSIGFVDFDPNSFINLIAGQNVGAQTASIASAQAKLTSALVEKQNTQLQAKRILEMADKGVVSKSDADEARAALATARANVTNAEADLERAKQQVAKEGEENSQVKAALLALEQAQLNLERTVIKAPTQGGVSNFSLSEGFYASAGQAIMTFVSTEDIWIEAYYRENSLGNVTVGDEVEVALDFAPDRIVKGRVSSIDWGVDWGQNDQAGKLAQASQQTGWLRQTQMLPITIEFEREAMQGMLRVGGQADVIVYSGDNFVFNAIGKLWIRFISVLSYVR